MPGDIFLTGLAESIVNGIGGIIFRLIPPPSHFGEPVVIARVAGRQIGSHFICANGQLLAVTLNIGGFIQAQLGIHNLTAIGNRGHTLDVHIGTVTPIVGGAVGLCAHIQPLTAQCRIIGCSLHGIGGIDILQCASGYHSQCGVNHDREFTVFTVDPFLVRFYSQDSTLFGFIQRKMNIKRAKSRSILHAGDGDLVNFFLIGIQERHRPILIQDSA